MQTLHLTAFINAAPKKVWDTMLSDAGYRQWTKAFSPVSYYKGEWKEGTMIHFLGTDAEGKNEGGMISRVKTVKPYELVAVEHIGMIMDGKEDTTSDTVKKWQGVIEQYTFIEKNGGTELVIDMDISDEEKQMLEGMWEKALEMLKELAEK